MDEPYARLFAGCDQCNQVLGAIYYEHGDSKIGGIEIVVDEGYRRLGIGLQLMAAPLAELHGRDQLETAVACATLHHVDLLCLWRKCGFIAYESTACQSTGRQGAVVDLVDMIYRRPWHREREGLGYANMSKLLLEGE